MKKAVCGIVLALLLTSMLSSIINIQPVKAWTGTVYIRADGSVDPPDAPIQRDGNVYTLTGNIASSADGIVVERDNIVIDGSGYTVRGAGSGGGIDISYRINVKIKNTIVTGFGAGIITDFSSSCTLFCNIVTGNLIGLHLWQSYNNTLYGNNINSNQYNFGVSGWEFSHYLHNIDVSNLVDGKPVFYLKNQKNLVITPFTYPHIGYLALINSTNIKIENLTMMNNVDGLLLVNTKYSTVINCIVTNNLYGIALSCSSNNNTLSGNIVTNNEYGGIYLRLSSNNNKLLSNKIADNWSGVFIYRSSNNSLTENNIAKNDYGFYLENSSNNYIYHNNFVENTIHIYSYYSINVWDDGYPSRGNYWSDYMGVDEKSGPNQDQPGSDGISDTPYIIDVDNKDRYPLMAPFSTFDAGVWDGIAYSVNIVSNSTVSDFYFNPDKGPFLSFNVTGDEGTVGFCRVTIPKNLLWTDAGWTITVGEQQITNYTEIEDEAYTYLYFTYQHSTQTVTIQGTHVIPEFPSTLILALFMMTTLTAAVLWKTKRKHQPP